MEKTQNKSNTFPKSNFVKIGAAVLFLASRRDTQTFLKNFRRGSSFANPYIKTSFVLTRTPTGNTVL
jgi:hypothetical protein